jgi:regulator of nucleoside diphosphate kinase
MPVNAQQTEPVSLVVRHLDYQRLVPLIRASELDLADALDAELSRAEIVADQDLPSDAVAMHSTVTFRDLATQADTTVTLVFPAEADVADKKISVLSPIGTALLGLRAGGRIHWPMPNGKLKHIEILTVRQN